MRRLLLLFFSCGIAVRLPAYEAYTPSITLAVDEPWRWSELEALLPYTVRDAAEAPDGKIWFGVLGGLVEYDGISTKTHWLADALEDRAVTNVFVASDGYVYGLIRDQIVRFREGEWDSLFETDYTAFTDNRVDEAEDGSIWFGLHSGLFRSVNGTVEPVECELESISNLIVDRDNRLWVSSSNQGKVLGYTLNLRTGLPEGEPFRIEWKPEGYPWFAVLGEGLDGRVWIASSSSRTALQYVDGWNTSVVLSGWGQLLESRVEYIFERPGGELWIISRGELLVRVGEQWIKRNANKYYSDNPFASLLKHEQLILGGRNDSVHKIDFSAARWKTYPELIYQGQDVSGAWWFISRDKRVVRHYPQSNSWVSFGPEDGLIDKPNSILPARDGVVWVSGGHGEDAAVSWLLNGVWHRESHPNFSRMISHQAALESSDGYIYFGTNMEEKNLANRSGGLLRYQNRGESVEYKYFTSPDAPQRITSIVQTADGTLWFSGRSLSSMQGESPHEVFKSFSDEWPVCLTVDPQDTLWVGNWREGLFKKAGEELLSITSPGKRAKFGVVNLLAGKRLAGIWAATIDGLNRFDGESWSQRVLIPELRFQRRGAQLLESPDGALWINTASPDWNFNSDLAFENKDSEFNSLRYFPDSMPPDTYFNHFESRVPESGTMHISWSGSDPWSLTSKNDLEYSYRLNRGAWTPFSLRAEAVLHSMPAGKFTMEVRARDADWNIDPSPAVAGFTVIPVLWKRPWFLAVVALTLVLILVLVFFMVRMRFRHILELEEFKIDFFTRISHELRTPLSVILGPLQSVLKTALERQKEPLEMAYRNARRMQGLIDTLLEFRKVELGKLSYEPVRADLEYFIRDVVNSHAVLWEEKNQKFQISVYGLEGKLCFDPEMLRQIVSNLLSNAIKYTPEYGCITVDVCMEQSAREKVCDRLRILVTDNGAGIPDSEKEFIFNPFYRNPGVKRKIKGTGIGLAHTYELISLWGGDISVESPVTQGTNRFGGSRFIVELPLIEDEKAPVLENDAFKNLGEPEPSVEDQEEAIKDSDKPTVLVIEDNSDMRAFLAMELKKRYHLLTARDGRQGLELAKEKMPELIITDLMMPEMDGFQLSAKLKTDWNTSHIPLLMLTAKGSDEFRLKGIKEGADDYFTKPVNIDILKARIESLLESRRLLREKFTRQLVVQPKEVTVTSADEQFLQKAMEIMEENISDESFGVDEFAVKVGTGRTSLYRKIKAVTGLTPLEFIKSMRLKRAAQLLATGEVNVSQTYEQVGFSSISYFSKVFRETYGCTPSEYRQSGLQDTRINSHR